MTYTPYVLPQITLRGTPFEIGKQLGELARDRVLQHLSNQKAVMARRCPENPDWWRSEVWNYLPPFEELAPHVVEEMQGLCRSANLTFEDALLLNVRDELHAALCPARAEGCTAFGCSGDVTLTGHPILGQTKDTAAISKDLYVVAAVYQDGRPDLLQMPYAGEFGVLGLSSSGMAILGTSLYVSGRPSGRIPCALFRRLVLEANDLDAVIALADQHGIASAGCFVIGDHTGRVIALENTGHGHAVVRAERGILTHANHVNAPHLAKHQVYEEAERAISVHRQARLASLLEAERGRLTAPMAMRLLMDHDGYPSSICRHPVPGRDFQTTASIVVEPAQGRLHAIRGLPCQAWPATYAL